QETNRERDYLSRLTAEMKSWPRSERLLALFRVQAIEPLLDEIEAYRDSTERDQNVDRLCIGALQGILRHGTASVAFGTRASKLLAKFEDRRVKTESVHPTPELSEMEFKSIEAAIREAARADDTEKMGKLLDQWNDALETRG